MILLLVAAVTLLPALVTVVSGVALMRRPSQVHRVPVEAVVVHVESSGRAATVTYDYPGPDGLWLRTTQAGGDPAGRPVQRGDRMTVWVDPTRPRDVALAPSRTSGRAAGVVLVVVGGVWGLLGLAAVTALVGEFSSGAPM